MKASQRSQVPPFAVMEIIAAVNAGRAAGRDIVNLCVGEPSAGAPQVVRRRAAELLSDGDLGYTEATGVPALKEAIAGHYRDWYDVEVDPRRVAITTGSSGGFVLAFLAAFEVGDRVVLARPGYPAYANILRALGCEVVELSCGPDTRYQPTVDLLDAISPPVDGLVIASPANPTGTMIEPHELAAIGQWCDRNGVRLISDEIYHGITYPGAGGDSPTTATAAAYPDLGAVVVNSFSKYWAMTGWRLGWLVLPEDLTAAVDALAGNIALCPPALPQHAALAAFTQPAMAEARGNVERYARTRARLLDRLHELGWDQVAPADGAFYLYADISASGLDSVTWCARLLEQAGVALTPGTDFDPVHGSAWARLSFAPSIELVDEAVDRIIDWQQTL